MKLTQEKGTDLILGAKASAVDINGENGQMEMVVKLTSFLI